jgi:hypothetical protein
MRWVIAAVVCLAACGARSEISGGLEPTDGGIVILDATIDVHDSGTADAPNDAAPDVVLCCDDGEKTNGCQTCSSGQTCLNKSGSCMTTVDDCGPSNCTGCCWNTTTCADGKTTGTCGNHGQLCQTCIAQNKLIACVADGDGVGGTCLGGPTCTSDNCHGGCCNGPICVLGDQDTLCGHTQTACVDCTVKDGTCNDGTCEYPHQ